MTLRDVALGFTLALGEDEASYLFHVSAYKRQNSLPLSRQVRTPVTVLSGALGAGKTTLLRPDREAAL